MGKATAIAWCDATFNLAWGCTKHSPGCLNCYAKTLSERWGFEDLWKPNGPRRTFGEKHWREPLKWNAEAVAAGRRRRVFTSSMADVFEDHPTIDAEREKLWALIRTTPALDWLVLTKRADRIAGGLPDDWSPERYPNVWLGVSVENQKYADERIPHLLAVPARVRFLSCEPLLGPIQLGVGGEFFDYGYGRDEQNEPRLHWIIVGGESGPGFRPMDLAWAKDLREQCRAAQVAFFMKQASGLKPGTGSDALGEVVQEFPAGALPLDRMNGTDPTRHPGAVAGRSAAAP